MYTLLVDAVVLGAMAAVWAVVLVDSGMLLQPVQRWLREAWRAHAGNELDEQWWWKPLWGCVYCVAGQAALWLFFARCYLLAMPYSLWLHLAFISFSILSSGVWSRIYQWSKE